MAKLLLVDDHLILRQGLKQILTDELKGAVFGEASDAAQALTQLRSEDWDLLILDINLPGRSGFDVLTTTQRDYPLLPVLVLSSTPEDQLALRALRAGAAGYLNKQAASEQLTMAVRQLLAGERFASKALMQKLVAELVRPGADRPRHESLSARELEVFQLCASGKSVKAIADELSLSAKTISTFRSRIFEKLALRNDVELANYARLNGLLDSWQVRTL